MYYDMYSKYTMTFFDVMEWGGGWNNIEARNKLFNNLYETNKAICDVLMEAFKYWEIGYEVPERFFHEFGEEFSRLLPEYNIRLKMWNELINETELLSNEYSETLRDIIENSKRNENTKNSGSDTRDITSNSDDTITGNTKQDVKTNGNQNTTENKNMVHSDTPGNNLDFTKNYADVAQKDNNTQTVKNDSTGNTSTTSNNNSTHTGSSNDTITFGKVEDTIKNDNRAFNEIVKKYGLRDKTKFQVYQLFTATSPDRWFCKQFDKVFMLIY